MICAASQNTQRFTAQGLNWGRPIGTMASSVGQLEHLADFSRRTAVAALEQEILPSGNLGWCVRPRHDLLTIGRYAFVPFAILLMSWPALADPSRRIYAILLDATMVVGTIALVWLYLRNAKVFADSSIVGKTDLFGRTKRLPTLESTAERFSVRNGYQTNRHLVFVGNDGRMAFKLVGPTWDFDRADSLCVAAGIRQNGSYSDFVNPFRLNKRVPGTLTVTNQLAQGFGLVLFIVVFTVLLDHR